MNKSVFEIVKKHDIHPISYLKKGNVYIISDKEKSYVIKLNTSNYDIYKYLISRDFIDFPENFNHKNDNYDISEYIDSINVNDEQKLNDLIKEIGFLHHKTSYVREIDLDDIKKIYESIKDDVISSKEYYYGLNDLIDKEMFFSPSMYLLVRNISLFYYLLEYCEKNLDKWYLKIKNEKNIRVCLLHNNIDIDHLIINDNKYLISWDKSYFDNPINDLEMFYRKYYDDLDLNEVLKIYESKNKLNEFEKELLLIRLALPKKIILSKDTFLDTKLINDEIVFLNKIYDEIKKNVKK